MSNITVSAPGKILLIGGYSILERPNIAYALTVDAYVHAKCNKLANKKIIISVPQLKIKIDSNTDEFSSVRANDINKFLVLAIKTTLQYFKFLNIPLSGFNLSTKSDNAFNLKKGKSGLGSSAAATVAIVAVLFKTFGLSLSDLNPKTSNRNLEEVHKIAQFAHAKAQGKIGSGFDVAAACHGSIKYMRYSPELLSITNPYHLFATSLDCLIKKINFPKNLKLIFASFPKESMSTINAVSRVMEYKRKNHHVYMEIMNNLNIENIKAIEALESEDLNLFKKHFQSGRVITKKLGKLAGVNVESSEHSKLIEETIRNGAFAAKLPGAGGGDAILAICKNPENAKKVKIFLKKKGLNVLDVNIINNGLI